MGDSDDEAPAGPPKQAAFALREAAAARRERGGAPLWLRSGRVVLAAGLVTSGEARLVLWRDAVIEAVRDRYSANTATADKSAAEAARLFGYLDACGAGVWADVSAALVLSWCWAARRTRSGQWRRAAPSTARNRQWIARAALAEAARLGAPVDPDMAAGARIARVAPSVSTRPLTDDEMDAARAYADPGLGISRRPLLLALSCAGGTAAEIAAVRWRDIDIDAQQVAFSGAAARAGPLDEWSQRTVRRFVKDCRREHSDALACVAEASRPAAAAHSVTVRLGQILRDAALSDRPGVTARSFRLTAARRMLDRCGIEAAARFLGSVSLDAAADAVGHDWHNGC